MKQLIFLWIGVFSLLFALAAYADPAAKTSWEMLAVEGAEGKLIRDKAHGGRWVLEKTTEGGYLLARCTTRPVVIPGKFYRISLTLEADSPTISGYLQLITLPQKRSPYPHSAAVTPVGYSRQVSCFLQMQPNENSLIINLVTSGQGKISILDMEVTPISQTAYQQALQGPLISQKEMSAPQLKDFGIATGLLESRITEEGIWEITLAPGNGIQLKNLSWDPESVAMIEWEAASEFEGGYWQLDVSSHNAAGKKITGYQTFSTIPDGKMRVHQFPVSRCGAWQGKIDSVKFSWNGPAPGKLRIGSMRALQQGNLIPGAKAGKNIHEQKIPLIRPRAKYRLVGADGFDGEAVLVMRDRDDKVLATVRLKRGEKEITFTVPELCVTALVSVSGCRKGFPCCTVLEIPPLNPAMLKWRGPWIWSRPGLGPERTSVWFRKRFTLPEDPVQAKLAITADDQIRSIRVNRTTFTSRTNWQTADLFDITKALHKGENEILVQVYNIETNAGLLIDADIRGENGDYSLWSDSSWECAESEEIPKKWHAGSCVLGRVPFPPWGEITYPEPPVAEKRRPAPSGSYALTPARVIRQDGRPQILAGKERLQPFYMDMPGRLKENPAAKRDLIRNASAIGSRIIRVHFRTLDAWKGENQFDFSRFDRMISTVQQDFPDAHILVVMDFAMPEWWLKKHPDSATAFADGTPRGWRDAQTLASDVWMTGVRQMLRAFVSHVKTKPYAPALLGLTVGEGWNLEWMWSLTDGKNQRNYSGFAPEAVRRYRQFLRDKYKTEKALSLAWGRPVKFDEVTPPGKRRDETSGEGTLLDLSKDRDIADFFQFRNECTGQAICRVAKIVKEESGGAWLVGVYYGYLVPFSYSYHNLQERGHLALETVARCPDVDFIIGPSYYHWRRIGMADGTMQPADTVTLRGKLLITEHDIRTFSDASDYEARNGRVNSVEESVGAMERAFGMMLTKGTGLHWMEMNETWFREKVLLDLANSFSGILDRLPPVQGLTPKEVCVVSDIDSCFCLKNNAADGVAQLCISEFLRRLPEAGFAWRHVTRNDLLEPGLVPPHKFYIMTNSLLLPQEKLQALQKRFAAEKATVLWLYAPGLYGGESDSPDIRRTEKLLQIPLAKRPAPLRLIPQPESGKLADFQMSLVLTGPYYLPSGGKITEILTRNKTDGAPLCVRCPDGPGGTPVYFSAYPVVSPKICREIAGRAGVRLYGAPGDSWHIGQDIVVLHAKTAGEKELMLPAGCTAGQLFGPPVTLTDGKFSAISGRTYGFLLKKQ